MRKLFLVGCLAVFAATLASAQEAQRTPPGGDTVGSDRSVQRGDIRTMPSASPDQNQIMTNSEGSTTGYENYPAFSGTSTVESQTEQGTGGNAGIQGQTPAIAGRLGAETGSSTGAPPAKNVKGGAHAGTKAASRTRRARVPQKKTTPQ